MTVNDAVWNIEAALNYNYCCVDLPQGNTYTDSLILEYPVENGKLLFSDIADAYLKVESKLKKLIKDDYHAIVIDVEQQQTSGLFKAKVTFIIGDGVKSKNVNFPNSFKPDDNWWWSWNIGKCDYSITCGDARSQLKYWLNSNLCYIPGQYFTNIEEVAVAVDPYSNEFKNNNDLIPNDNYLDYKIFINSRQGIDTNGNVVNLPNFVEPEFTGPCITNQEMNFYSWSYRELAINYTNNGGIRPFGKSIVSYNITSHILKHQYQNMLLLYWTRHVLRVKYGILHFANQN